MGKFPVAMNNSFCIIMFANSVHTLIGSAARKVCFYTTSISNFSHKVVTKLHLQVASLASLAQLLLPRSPTVSNPAPDSSLCRAAAPRLRPLAPLLRPLQLLLAACVHFESAAAPWPDCICFNCCSPIAPASAAAACSPLASASAAAPDRVRFGCCSPIASASTAAPRLRLQPQLDSSPMFSNILRGVRSSVNKLKYEGRASL